MRDAGPVFVVGVMLLALNLRPAVTDVPSILDEIGHHYGYSSVALTVLTTVPVVCFGLFSPLAGRLGHRLGDERGLAVAIALIGAGQALRAFGPGAALFPGTVIADGGIAIMNVLLSSLVKRRAPDRAAQLLGAYLAMLYVGAMAGSAISVPLYHAGDRSVALPLGVWVVPAAVALALWVPQLGKRTEPDEAGQPALLAIRRSPLAWQVTAFMGLQSLTYYGSISILPDLYRSRGMDASTAGLVNTMLSLGGVLTAVSAPALVARYRMGTVAIVGSGALSVIATAATIVMPVGAALPIAFVLGLGQGVSISLALYYIMARAETPAVAAALSAMAQGFGYLIAVVGPLGAGLLHSLTGGWGASIALISAVTALTIVFGIGANRNRQVRTDGSTVPTGA